MNIRAPLRRMRVLLGSAICFLAMAAATAMAQEFPNRAITIILGFSAGGSTDSLMRLIGQGLSEALKVPVIIENKPGGNQLIAIRALKSRPADGYTLYAGTGSSLAQFPALSVERAYDPLADFTLISRIGLQPGVIAVSPALNVNSIKDLVDFAKKNPNKLTYGTQGHGSASHLAMEYFMARTGVDLVRQSLKSDGDIVTELMANRIDVSFMTTTIALPFAAEQKIKIIGVTSRKRLDYAAEFPTVGESGFPGLDGLDPLTFYGLVGPSDMPTDVRNRLSAALAGVVRSPEVHSRMRDTLRIEPAFEGPDGFRKYIEDEIAKWADIGRQAKIEIK